jgi:capsule biosynthesis phosphatase
MRLCFDLDETLCHGEGDYIDSKPDVEAIQLLRKLSEDGHTIIVYTARGMGSSKGNPGQATAAWGFLTCLQLDTWGVPYDEIYFGKPGADLYFDDKAVNVESMKSTINVLLGEQNGSI